MITQNLKTHKYYSLLQLTTYGCFLLLLLISSPFTSAERPSPPAESLSIGRSFNPTMAILMVGLVCAFFILGFFSIYIRQCIERRFRRVHGTATEASGGDGGGPPRRASLVGLDASVIETFPTFLYSSVKGLKIGKGSLECAVCLNEFEGDETLRLVPKCCHVFHPECIDAWLASHVTCPVCRANLVPKPDDLPSGSVRLFETSEHNLEPVEPHPSQAPVGVFVDGLVDSQTRRNPPEMESSEANLLYPVHQNRSFRSWSTRWQFRGMLFPRSHSTGHSLVQPGENMERFTLRLPEDVRNQIINTAQLNRTKSNVVFARARSSRRGYRSTSVGSIRRNNYFNYERFDRDYGSNHPGFSLTSPKSNLKSVESTGLNLLNVKKDDQKDEGSSDWLRHYTSQV